MISKTTPKRSKAEFKEICIHDWPELLGRLREFPKDEEWVFRGQTSDWPLTTALERACDDSDVDLEDAPNVESQMIRSFQRSYSGNDLDAVLNDKLYCMALMQHHGAPTRLLDFTYSPYIAAHNALEKKPDKNFGVNVIWCLSGKWCKEKVEAKVGSNLQTVA